MRIAPPTSSEVEAEAEPCAPDVLRLIREGSVAVAGRLASVTREQLADIISTFGGRGISVDDALSPYVSVIVVGQKDWLLTRDGRMPEILRRARIKRRQSRLALPVIPEAAFLDAIGRGDLAESGPRQYTTATLVELLGVPREHINAWVRAGLIEPARVEHGVWYFDFRQVTAARTLCDLWRSGVSVGRLRRSLDQLRSMMPGVERPLEQLAAIERSGDLLIRLEAGELTAADGQLIFEFDALNDADAAVEDQPSMRLMQGPATAWEWHAQGIEQEQAGYLDEAVASYREALSIGGPDAQICFDVAHCLHALGQRQQALERYLQATEIDRDFADAWNNLGLLLCEMGRQLAACTSFRRALAANPNDARAHYNLADTLDELHLEEEAADHWRAYLRYDSDSDHADHARQRVAVANAIS